MGFSADFFARSAAEVAPELLGACIVHDTAAGRRVGRIVEVEAYVGAGDAACHARFGRTARTRSLFLAPGHAYVFLVYGMHHCFNVTTLREGAGHAVLVRGVELLEIDAAQPHSRGDGPGRAARALSIAREQDGQWLLGDGSLRLQRGAAPHRVQRSARVGVGYAKEHAEWPLRFYEEGSRGVSRPSPRTIGLGGSSAVQPAEARRRS